MLPLAFGFGAPGDIAIIAVVVLLLFGGSKFAEWGKGLGGGIREFKKATQDDTEDKPISTEKSSTVIKTVPVEEPGTVAVGRTEEK